MNKQEQALRQALADAKAAAETLMGEGKQEEAKAKIAEAKEAKNALDNFLDVQNLTAPEPVQAKTGLQPVKEPKEEPPQAKYKEVFLKALRGKKLSEAEAGTMQEFKAALSENTDADGGYIVPEDISTAINKLKNTEDSLEQYVNVQPVSTNKGSRTLEVRADSTPFLPLSEYGTPNAMPEMASPQFSRIDFAIDDYAGFLPVPNDLLADTDQALESYLRAWIAKKSKATRNSLILAQLATLAKVPFTNEDDIKTTINVTLDPAFAAIATITTNQDGFNYLDQLKDGDNRPLLQPDPTNSTRKILFGRSVVVLSNKTIASTPGTGTITYPFIIGDLKEAVILWDRQQLSVDMTKVGGNTWRTNTTEFRAIERDDCTVWDAEAVVYGQMTVATA